MQRPMSKLNTSVSNQMKSGVQKIGMEAKRTLVFYNKTQFSKLFALLWKSVTVSSLCFPIMGAGHKRRSMIAFTVTHINTTHTQTGLQYMLFF